MLAPLRVRSARDLIHPVEEVAFSYSKRASLADGVRNAVKQAGLTMAQLSAITAQTYGHDSRYFIPPTFLYKLRAGISPHILQIAALSEITGCPFPHCMQACGFDLDDIFRWQQKLHIRRTVLVTPSEWELFSAFGISRTAPGSTERYWYAKIGHDDAAASAELTPGSLVRVDRFCLPSLSSGTAADSALWLVKHQHGLTCGRIGVTNDRQIVLLPIRAPFFGWPLHISSEVRIVGLVDSELRGGRTPQIRPFPRALPRRVQLAKRTENGPASLSQLLRVSRSRAGLTYRAAHELTMTMARRLGREYSIALGLLSDYEAMDRVPRHMEKVMSLCAVYCIDIRELLRLSGSYIDHRGSTSLQGGSCATPVARVA
jgi:hypothetical protein